jgi:hypothetical protein
MKNLVRLLMIAVTGSGCLTSLQTWAADAPATTLSDPRVIMQKVYDREDGNHSVMDMEMILIDKNGAQRTRQVKSYGRDAGPDGKDSESIMFFLSPADVKNTGFLSYDYYDDAKDDDQWLYLPALKKVKRIASSDKSSSFMGTDFTYSDMNERHIKNYDYKLLKEDLVNGDKVWVIEATPITEKEKEETGYTKTISFVRQDNFVVIRALSFVEKGSRLKYMDTKKLELIDGVWVASEVTMTTKKDKETLHQTVLKLTNVKFNQPQPADTFSTRRLEKGL